MQGFKPNSYGRRLSGFSPLHESISEEHALHTFDHSEGQDNVVDFPSSPRQRSFSVYESGRTNLLCPNLNTGKTDSLPKLYKRSQRHLGRLNTQLLIAVKSCKPFEVQRLLDAGANPNTTCHTEYITACHIAALHNNEILSILLQHGAERNNTDGLGRTPLHLAAWAGNVNHILTLLNFPEDIQKKFANGETTLETEEEIEQLSNKADIKDIVDVRCVLGELNMLVPKPWRDNIDHSCKDIELPFIQPGWTPLHVAASNAHHLCCRVLLAAGADAGIRDLVGRTPLDVAGSGCIGQQNKQLSGPTLPNHGFTEVIKMLVTQSSKRGSFTKIVMLDTPLHTAVELENLDAIKLLLKAGNSPRNLNRAGLTPLHLCVKKRLKQHLQAFIYTNSNDDEVPNSKLLNMKDKDGNTVLHYAVLHNWAQGVSVALEAHANILLSANDGETPLHAAAALGNLEILTEILFCAKKLKVIDILNQKGATPLFKSICNGHTDCVKILLKAGASIEITLPKQYNVFHIAAKLGHYYILKLLLDHNYTFTREKVNVTTVDDRKGYGPIHFAVENNYIDCVKLLLSKNAFVSLKTSNWALHADTTPLHIAATKNNLEIAKILVKFDPLTIYNVDAAGWTALHTASYCASRDVIKFLICEGANLSACTKGPQKYQKTAIEIIMNNLSKPTEFMESIFDMYIHTFNNKDSKLRFGDPDTKVQIDYSILVPKSASVKSNIDLQIIPNEHFLKKLDTQLSVVEALLKTGNRHGQRRLLIHPLVESFLCLKWKALLPFFYVMLFFYGLFVTTLTIFIMSQYIYTDSKSTKPFGFDANIWAYALYATIALILLQEIINMTASYKLYFLRLETWIKLSSILLAIILPNIVEKYPYPSVDGIDWPRHIATMAILLCWLDMTFLLSRFPSWGYYVLMFGKVSTNVLKILLTFAFLVIGFALSFMIQFHHQSPFETFGSALVKTMVMMTSEFDYDDLVDAKEKSKNVIQSLTIIRLLFLTFLVLAAIVLMNLMVGVAVNDLNNLELLGNIMRLEKQVEFLASLETLVLKRVFLKLLPAKWVYNLELSSRLTKIILKPCEPAWSYYKAIPSHVREAIFEKALALKKNEDHQISYETLKKQLGDIHETIKGADLVSHHKVPKRLTDTDMMVVKMKRQMDDLNTKVDMMMQLLISQSLKD